MAPQQNVEQSISTKLDSIHYEFNVALLTTPYYTVSIRSGNTSADTMLTDPRLEQAFSLIRTVIADADKRAVDNLVAALQERRPSTYSPPPGIERRAPRGSAAALIDRVLTEVGEHGAGVPDIQNAANTEFEKRVSVSAIRAWLKQGESTKPPKYRRAGGIWFLVPRVPARAHGRPEK